MKNQKVFLICLIFLPLVLMADLTIAVVDLSGEEAVFYDPDSSLGYIRPIMAVENAFDALDDFDMNEELEVDYFYEMPDDLDEYNILYLIFGWGDCHTLTEAEQLDLISYMLGGEPGDDHALIVEGNDFCENYGDTSSSHFTYTDLMDFFAVTLREPTGSYFDELYGQIGSFADGMVYDYPSDGSGPGLSPDDIIINEESDFYADATYLFDVSTKSPARGMQRRGYTPSTDRQAGATVLLPFVFGNLEDGEYTKADLLYKIIDFVTVPVSIFTTPWESNDVEAYTHEEIEIYQYDKVKISDLRVEYSSDAGTSWIPIYVGEPEPDFETIVWSVPPAISSNCYLRVIAEDESGIQSTHTVGPFDIMLPFDTVENNLPKQTSIKAYPNPFNSTCIIDVPNDQEDLSIFNISGQEVYKATGRTINWQPEENSAGIYYIKSGTHREKIIFIP